MISGSSIDTDDVSAASKRGLRGSASDCGGRSHEDNICTSEVEISFMDL